MKDKGAREDIKFVRGYVFKIYENLFSNIVDLTKIYVSLRHRIEKIERTITKCDSGENDRQVQS
jgi:hypothetical protein